MLIRLLCRKTKQKETLIPHEWGFDNHSGYLKEIHYQIDASGEYYMMSCGR